MGNYFFTPTVAPDGVYTLQQEEKERTMIDNYMDQEINTKNFWYWGFIDDLITDKMLANSIEDDDLSANLLSQTECEGFRCEDRPQQSQGQKAPGRVT